MSGKFSFKNGRFSKKWPFFLYAFVLVLVLSNCKKKESPQYDKVLVEVNDFEITVFDFENEYIKHLIKTGRNDTENQRYYFLNELIDEAVFAQEASTTELLDNEFYRTAIDFQRRKSMMDAYFADEMDNILEDPTDDQLRLDFAKSKRKVYVRHLFSRNEKEVVQAYKRLEKGEKFIDVANEFYETATYDSAAGYLGPISYFSVDNAFAEAAFSTNEGEFTKPVRSRFGYHVIYIEYIEFPAILAEDEYQYRKKGLTSQVRLRTQALQADEYVRDLMEGLMVEISSENILELRDVISSLSSEQISNTKENGDNESQSDIWNNRLLDNLRNSYNNEAVLATYLYNGERIPFTFGDYLKWLPYLSFNESKSRTGASIGRGLRNEVLYKMSEEKNYSDDPRIHKQVSLKGYEVLSGLYRHKLIIEALDDTVAMEIPSNFRERLIKDKKTVINSTYWKIKAGTRQEAQTIKKDLLNNEDPQNYPEFEYFENVEMISQEKDYSLVKNGLIGTPIVAHSGEDGWVVLHILSRSESDIRDDNSPEDLENRYKVFRKLNSTVFDLRESANIRVDSVLFNEIYDLYKKKKEAS